MARDSIPVGVRFWRYVRRGERTADCWRWIGAVDHAGYGVISNTVKSGVGVLHGNRAKASRISYHLHHGKIPDGLHVLHTCVGSPWCVNPKHLKIGTPAENAQDRKDQGRATGGQPPGENHPRGKLKDADMKAIQEEYAKGGTSYRALATKFGCSKRTVLNIVSGKCRVGKIA